MKIRPLFFFGMFTAAAVVFTPAMAETATTVSPEIGFRPATSTIAETFKPKKKKKAKQKKNKKHCEAY